MRGGGHFDRRPVRSRRRRWRCPARTPHAAGQTHLRHGTRQDCGPAGPVGRARYRRATLTWLAGSGLARRGLLVRNLAASRDADGFARLRAVCEPDSAISDAVTSQVAYRSALLLASKGGTVNEITVGDVVELFAAEDRVLASHSFGRPTFYRVLGDLGVLGDRAPVQLRGLSTVGQRTPEELIDRYHLVDYLRERQPALDYASLRPPGVGDQRPCDQGSFFASCHRKSVGMW